MGLVRALRVARRARAAASIRGRCAPPALRAENPTCPSTFSSRRFRRARLCRICGSTFSRRRSRPSRTLPTMFSSRPFRNRSRFFWIAPSVTSPRGIAPRALGPAVRKSSARRRRNARHARRALGRRAPRRLSSARRRPRWTTGCDPSWRRSVTGGLARDEGDLMVDPKGRPCLPLAPWLSSWGGARNSVT